MNEICLEVLGFVVALAGIGLTCCQISQSNKHAFFDKRVRVYSLSTELMENFKNIKDLINIDEIHNEASVKIISSELTNSPTTYECFGGINNRSHEDKVFFLKKCFELNQSAETIDFLFSDKKILKIKEFIKSYVELMDATRKFNIFAMDLDKRLSSEEWARIGMSKLQEQAKSLNLSEKFLNLKKIYETVQRDKILELMKKEIKIEQFDVIQKVLKRGEKNMNNSLKTIISTIVCIIFAGLIVFTLNDAKFSLSKYNEFKQQELIQNTNKNDLEIAPGGVLQIEGRPSEEMIETLLNKTNRRNGLLSDGYTVLFFIETLVFSISFIYLILSFTNQPFLKEMEVNSDKTLIFALCSLLIATYGTIGLTNSINFHATKPKLIETIEIETDMEEDVLTGAF